MSQSYHIEYTDTFADEPNYSWVRRATITLPELTHYGYSGSADGTYSRANRIAQRELVRRAKAAIGLTNVRGVTTHHGDSVEFRPYKSCTVMFVNPDIG